MSAPSGRTIVPRQRNAPLQVGGEWILPGLQTTPKWYHEGVQEYRLGDETHGRKCIEIMIRKMMTEDALRMRLVCPQWQTVVEQLLRTDTRSVKLFFDRGTARVLYRRNFVQAYKLNGRPSWDLQRTGIKHAELIVIDPDKIVPTLCLFAEATRLTIFIEDKFNERKWQEPSLLEAIIKSLPKLTEVVLYRPDAYPRYNFIPTIVLSWGPAITELYIIVDKPEVYAELNTDRWTEDENLHVVGPDFVPLNPRFGHEKLTPRRGHKFIIVYKVLNNREAAQRIQLQGGVRSTEDETTEEMSD